MSARGLFSGPREPNLTPQEIPRPYTSALGLSGGTRCRQLNQRPRAGNWLIVEPRGIASNRSATGARVEVRAGGRVQKGEVRSSRGYYSSSGLRVHFGLGGTQKLDEVRVFWPSGRESTLHGVAVIRVLAVREPEQ